MKHNASAVALASVSAFSLKKTSTAQRSAARDKFRPEESYYWVLGSRGTRHFIPRNYSYLLPEPSC